MKPVKEPIKSQFEKGGRYAITLTKGRSIRNPDISCFQPLPRRDDLVCGIDYSNRLGAMEIQVISLFHTAPLTHVANICETVFVCVLTFIFVLRFNLVFL